jgi:hypothetical protein
VSASRLGLRRVTASYPARFERFAYVESIPQYTPHGKKIFIRQALAKGMASELRRKLISSPVREDTTSTRTAKSLKMGPRFSA